MLILSFVNNEFDLKNMFGSINRNNNDYQQLNVASSATILSFSFYHKVYKKCSYNENSNYDEETKT